VINTASLFIFERGQYLPTDWARGPWDPRFLHGGPPAALLAHALASELGDPALLLTRITIDLLRPIRQVPLTVSTRLVREGKRFRLVDAFLSDDETVVARAAGLMLRRMYDAPAVASQPARSCMPSWENLSSRQSTMGTEAQLFHRGTDMRPVFAAGSEQPRAVWFHAPYLLMPDTPLSGLLHAAAIADYANAVGTMSDPQKRGFINADITLSLHREPEGEWLCLECVGRPDRAGIATSSVNVHDSAGLLGAASTSCLATTMRQNSGVESTPTA
jgi:hypothetical protein